MKRKNVFIVMIVAAFVLAAAGCTGNGSSNPSGPVKAKWINAAVTGDTITFPKSDVDRYTNVHFSVDSPRGKLTFMAYNLNDRVYVRANVCPPCNSIGFSLSGDTLVCDSCGTKFNAASGGGISGACVAYPKDEVPHTVQDGKIVMKLSDAITAYTGTLTRG